MNQRKEDNVILAICYDFDKTLSPDDMQSQGYIQSLEQGVKEFWTESNKLAEDKQIDQILAYMYMMALKAHGKFIVNKDKLRGDGAKIKLFPGVETWFKRVNQYGADRGITVKHYIISSGLQEMIEGTSIRQNFDKIYACSFFYDDGGVAIWPAQVVNYTNKTQFLFRIEKGALDINDSRVNDFVSPENYAVPFRNMIYIGDSETDIPCMKLVNAKGGYSVGVFNPETQDKTKVLKMLHDNRIRYFVPADYSEGTDLEILIKEIIDKTAANEKLEARFFACMKELQKYEEEQSEEEREKMDLINKLEDSDSFRTTHTVIKELQKFEDWSEAQINKLLQIAKANKQVTYILTDGDVKRFFGKLCRDNQSKEAEEIRKIINAI